MAGVTFALSSLLTPFFMGTVVGAIATGAIPADPSGASMAAWTSPTAVLIGLLFVAACGYLAAVYLTGEAARRGQTDLQAYFTRRAQAAALTAGALSLATLAGLHGANHMMYSRLTGRALPLVITAGVCGLAVVTLLALHQLRGVRIIAVAGVTAVIWGWGVAQYPVLLPGTSLTLSTAGAPATTMDALVILFIVATALIAPSFALLFALQHVLAGARSFREIGDQAADLPQDMLAALGGIPCPLRPQDPRAERAADPGRCLATIWSRDSASACVRARSAGWATSRFGV